MASDTLDDMKLKFLGAAGTVTGSCYFLEGKSTGIMVDCGMFQGLKEDDKLNFAKPEIDFGGLNAVVLTHAHLDHCGRLPTLVRYGFDGPVFMNAPTKALTELVLMDSAKIAAEDATDTLYTEDDVQTFLKKVQIVDYHVPFTIGDFRLTMYDAGHIIGSSSILVEEISSGKKIVFCGDLGNTPEPLLLPTETFKEADFTLLESTYGDEVHGVRNEAQRIAEIVQEAERVGGVVMIPTFSIERAQEVLYLFDQLKKQKEIREDTPVFLDSPMAIKATEIFKDYPEFFSKKLKDQVKTDDPFDFPGLVVCDTVEKSKQIKNYSGTKVIVAGSGMMTGGRIIHHAINYLEDPKTIIVFVGFQAVGTLGRQIKDGEKNINIWGNHIEVRAQVEEVKSMSSHADQEQLLSWVVKINGLKKVVLVHGEDLPRLVLKEKIKNELGDIDVIMPNLNMQIEL